MTDNGTTALQPSIDEPDTGPFWAATAEHRLTYQVCRDCGGVVFYPRGHCTHCVGTDLEWRESAGLGTLYTYSVVRDNRQPGLAELVPYAVALVDLDEGFRLLTRLVDVEMDQIRIGARVQVRWRDLGEVSLPEFTLEP
jgi:hypothetical protein